MSNTITLTIVAIIFAASASFMGCHMYHDDDVGYYLAARPMISATNHYARINHIMITYGNEIADIATNCVSMTNKRPASNGNGTVSEFEMNKLASELHEIFYTAMYVMNRPDCAENSDVVRGVIAHADHTLAKIMRTLNFSYNKVLKDSYTA